MTTDFWSTISVRLDLRLSKKTLKVLSRFVGERWPPAQVHSGVAVYVHHLVICSRAKVMSSVQLCLRDVFYGRECTY